MRVVIIGAGFTGLASAYRLSQAGIEVTVLEKENQPGGLAIGFKDPSWDWSLEKHYHHLFVSDYAIRQLASQINHPIFFSRPKTSTYISNQISQLDSPLSLLKFSHLSLAGRLRSAMALAFLKINPFWGPLESVTASNFIQKTMGPKVWSGLWEPLFSGKFGNFAGDISATWFWARIHKRSSALGYPGGGFQSLADSIASACAKGGVKIKYGVSVDKISSLQKEYDKVICTLPTPQFSKISGIVYPKLQGIGAVNLVLSLSNTFLTDGTYWLNINDRTLPFLAVVEHTNFVSPTHYGGDHLLYVGNYLPPTHKYFSYSAQELVHEFFPYLKKINPDFTLSQIKKSWVWTAPFAQPIVDLNYSQRLPALATQIDNVYLANIQQVYPWDRGTNYAVELGNRVADLCLKN